MLEDTYVGQEGYENVGSIVLTWKAFIYSYLTSVWGALPMDEALTVTDGNTYRYNTEEEISIQVLRDLQKAVNTFDPAKDKLDVDPFIHSRTEPAISRNGGNLPIPCASK